jgi:hypothetical protein
MAHPAYTYVFCHSACVKIKEFGPHVLNMAPPHIPMYSATVPVSKLKNLSLMS